VFWAFPVQWSPPSQQQGVGHDDDGGVASSRIYCVCCAVYTAPTAKICQNKHPRLNYWSENNFVASWSIMIGGREDALLVFLGKEK
jgi:hypothetical protein